MLWLAVNIALFYIENSFFQITHCSLLNCLESQSEAILSASQLDLPLSQPYPCWESFEETVGVDNTMEVCGIGKVTNASDD